MLLNRRHVTRATIVCVVQLVAALYSSAADVYYDVALSSRRIPLGEVVDDAYDEEKAQHGKNSAAEHHGEKSDGKSNHPTAVATTRAARAKLPQRKIKRRRQSHHHNSTVEAKKKSVIKKAVKRRRVKKPSSKLHAGKEKRKTPARRRRAKPHHDKPDSKLLNQRIKMLTTNLPPFVEPQMQSHCWLHLLVTNGMHKASPDSPQFSPQCSADGSYAAKQCYLGRCWCVNTDGSSQLREDRPPEKRFYVGLSALLVVCHRNGHRRFR